MPSAASTTSASPSLCARSRRKRSSATGSSKDTTLQSCSSTSSLVYPVPESIAWLEQLSLTLRVDAHAKADACYVLTVAHAKSNSEWHQARSFDDYRAFQRRLLKALSHGHFCHAECPWLYTFVRSYFPRSSLLGHVLARKQVLEQRRTILSQCLVTLLSFLATRSNHSCSVLTTAVADEVLAFINGDQGAVFQLRHGTAASPANALNVLNDQPGSQSSEDDGSTHGGSWGSNSLSGEESSGAVLEDNASHDDENICGLCHSYLADEAYSPISTMALLTPTLTPSANETQPVSPVNRGTAAVSKTNTVSSSMNTPSRSQKRSIHFYTTRLACGHQFHDECIVPKLNESMHCPTCGQHEA